MRISDWSSDVCSSDLRAFVFMKDCQCVWTKASMATSFAGPSAMDAILRISSACTAYCFSKSLDGVPRSEEHTSELQSLMRISYAVFCLKKHKCYFFI